MKLILIGMLAALLPLGAIAACPPDRQVTTKDGYYGVLSQRDYSALSRAMDSRSPDRIRSMLKARKAVKLPAGGAACLLKRSAVSTRAQIRLEPDGQELWVPHTAFDKTS